VSERWVTPPEIFDPLHLEFGFDLDAAADSETTRLPRYLWDALVLDDWPGERIWLNPPYGRKLESFVRRAAAEAAKGKTVVAMIPLRGRAAWWHEAVIGRAVEVRFVRKRPRFLTPEGERPKFMMSCDSAIIVWRGIGNGTTAALGYAP